MTEALAIFGSLWVLGSLAFLRWLARDETGRGKEGKAKR